MKPLKTMKPPGKNLHVRHEGHRENALLWTAVAACMGLGVLLGWRQIASPDIGFHLSSARWMVEHHAWPSTDLFSFTFTGHRYLDLQWLFQLLLYGAHHLGGTAAILVIKILVTLAFWATLVVRARRSSGTLPWSVPLLLLLVALGDYFEERPHLFSWLFGSLMLLVLEEFARGRRRWLPALPAIMLLWVNTHQLFVLGLVIVGVYAAWEVRKGAQADRRLLVCALLSVVACVVNPYHVQALVFPLTLFGEMQSTHAFATQAVAFTELQSPFSTSLYFLAGRFVLFQPPLYWHVYTVLMIAGLVGGWRQMRLPNLVLWALFAYVFAMAHKNFGYFVMATLPMGAAGLDRALSALRLAVARRRARPVRVAQAAGPRALVWTPIVLAIALVPLVLSGRLYALAWSEFPIRAGFNRRFLPVEAAQFLNDHQIQGNVLTTFNYGSYVSWATRLPVSIYGIQEVFGPEFYAEYVASLGPQGFPAFLAKWKPTVAVVSVTDAPYWLYYLSTQPDWRLAQFNENAAVFLQDSVAGPPELPPARPGVDFTPHTRDEMKRVIAAASDRPDMTLGAWLQGHVALQQGRMRLSTLYMYTGRLEACVNTGIDALAASPIRVMEQLLVLGNAFSALGDDELSDLCFAGALRSSLADATTRQQVQTAVAARARRQR